MLHADRLEVQSLGRWMGLVVGKNNTLLVHFSLRLLYPHMAITMHVQLLASLYAPPPFRVGGSPLFPALRAPPPLIPALVATINYVYVYLAYNPTIHY